MTKKKKTVIPIPKNFYEPPKTKKELYAHFRDARVISVLKVEVNEGDGSIDDPICRVAYLLSLDGEVLAKLGETQNRQFAGDDQFYDHLS